MRSGCTERAEILKAFIEIIMDHIRCWRQILRLAKSDIIKTYKGAALGWSWAIIRPAVTVGMYFFAFTVGLRVGRPVGEYPYALWLVSGMIPWFYMSNSLEVGAASIRKYRFLVTKIRYPLSTIPTFVNLGGLVVHLFLLLLLLVVFLVCGMTPDIYWLQLPFYTLLMFLLFNALSLFTSILSCISVDFLHLLRSITMVLFWTSGILYNASQIEIPFLRAIVLCNPITVIVDGYRNSLIYKEWFWENPAQMQCYAVFFVLVTILSLIVYNKWKKDLPDVL